MSDLLEQELRDVFASRVEAVVPRVIARLSTVDFQPRRAQRRLLAKIGAASGLVTGGVVAAVLLLGSGAPEAFAGWTAIPSGVSTGSLATARRACGIAPGGRVLAAESRGPFVAIVFTYYGNPWQCITRGTAALMKTTTEYPAGQYEPMPADKISTPSLAFTAYTPSAKNRVAELTAAEDRLFRKHEAGPVTYKIDDRIYAIKTGPDGLLSVTGTAGKGVKAVQFVLADGNTVSATVHDGWYEAWWPGTAKPGGAKAASVKLTTVSGSRSTKVVYELPIFGSERCGRGSACSIFAPIRLKQGVAPALTAHFAFFKNSQPSSRSSESRPLRRLTTNPLRVQTDQSYGIDRSQTRVIKLPGGSVDLIMPGTEGLCETFAQTAQHGITVSTGGCEDLQSVLRWGEFGISNATGPAGSAYTLHGLVPNGNRTVIVKMMSGAKLTVPVHDNIVYATFSTTPKWVKFINAFGYIKRHPA
jgi:hypothetical protein